MKTRTQGRGRVVEYALLIITIAAAFGFTIILTGITRLRLADVGKQLEPYVVEPGQIVTGSIKN